jgi:hypothetical protein
VKLTLVKVKAYAAYAKKAVAILVVAEGTAVTEGLISQPVAATVTAVLGVASSALAFALSNGSKPAK